MLTQKNKRNVKVSVRKTSNRFKYAEIRVMGNEFDKEKNNDDKRVREQQALETRRFEGELFVGDSERGRRRIGGDTCGLNREQFKPRMERAGDLESVFPCLLSKFCASGVLEWHR